MLKILCSRYSFPSGRLLRNILSEIRNEKILVTSNPDKIKTPSVRYGNSSGIFSKDTALNSPEFIRMCSSKLTFSNLLITNKFYTPVYDRNNNPNNIFPVLIRKTLSGSGGKGIILCRDRKEFDDNWNNNYWTKYIPTEFELRVHVLGGEVSRIFRKELETNDEFPIRNNATCHFSIKNSERYPKLKELISSLNDLFLSSNLHFGFYALDIGWDKNTKEYFIFEANSAPGLNEHTAELYANFINDNLEVEGS